MDLHYLEYIIEIANTRNMTKAAANLFITQPALSKMLKKVEKITKYKDHSVAYKYSGVRIYKYVTGE